MYCSPVRGTPRPQLKRPPEHEHPIPSRRPHSAHHHHYLHYGTRSPRAHLLPRVPFQARHDLTLRSTTSTEAVDAHEAAVKASASESHVLAHWNSPDICDKRQLPAILPSPLLSRWVTSPRPKTYPGLFVVPRCCRRRLRFLECPPYADHSGDTLHTGHQVRRARLLR